MYQCKYIIMYNIIYLHCINVKAGIIIFSFDTLLNTFPQCRSWNVILDLKKQTQIYRYLALFGVWAGDIVFLHSICYSRTILEKDAPHALSHFAACPGESFVPMSQSLFLDCPHFLGLYSFLSTPWHYCVLITTLLWTWVSTLRSRSFKHYLDDAETFACKCCHFLQKQTAGICGLTPKPDLVRDW